MNGRMLFDKFNVIIKFITILFDSLPNVITNFIYNHSRNSESKIAIFIRFLYVKKNAKSCGDNIYIGQNVVIKGLQELDLKNNISIHAFSYIDATGGLVINDNTSIASHVCIYTFEHTWSNIKLPIKYNNIRYKKVYIENDVWIGTNSVILGGVTIEHRSIIAAGAVVNSKVRTGTIVGGVPAKLIKQI
ncbi:acyltransferase [Mammaliicoccus sciuri]|uniref:acyltransferase n=1 Tax=Mammaliicoccus sciuri TaxID=1296 RepID=UPI001FB56CF4|nr:acyltransferase [Mammaliicoccus sciuri]MCJ0971248.1 acyltransferase [Mammaliicoccus sciuri]MEB7815610.1 acyltransferase [Mammaliicoccus sciuri]WQJ41849.1 acyltransferase [Mammaliicoccus sciuri]